MCRSSTPPRRDAPSWQTRTGMMTGDGLQEPEAVYPRALALATLPAGGPSGRAFWNGEEHHLLADAPE